MYEWDVTETSEIVLEDWDRNGKNYPIEFESFPDSEEAKNIAEGICPKCESEFTVLFKKEAHKFVAEDYRVCANCHTVYSYHINRNGSTVDLELHFYQGEEIVDTKVIPNVRVIRRG